MTRIVLVRHGQTEWNRDGRFRGRIDVDLDARGRAQARACARRIVAEWQPVAVLSSPLARAVHTAEAIGRLCNRAVEARADLIDLDFGEWQGLTLEQARSRTPDLVEAWLRSPSGVRPPRGETLAELQARAWGEFLAIVSRHAGGTVVMVAHDVVNRVLLLTALDAGLDALARVGQDTSAVNLLEATPSGFAVVTLNDTRHLDRRVLARGSGPRGGGVRRRPRP